MGCGWFFVLLVVEIELLGVLECEIFGFIVYLVWFCVCDLDFFVGVVNKFGYGFMVGIYMCIDGVV